MGTIHAGRTGFVTSPPPVGWDSWAREEKVELATLRDYAQAVYAATDAYLATLTDDALSRPVDMSEVGMGEQPVAAVIGLALLNGALHCGEISCLKGLQGLTGYPPVQQKVAS